MTRPPWSLPGLVRAALASRASLCSGQTKVTRELLDHLERLALVDVRNQEGVERLKKAIEFAEQPHAANTDGVEPMDSVLEDRDRPWEISPIFSAQTELCCCFECLYLRADETTEGHSADELLKTAKRTVEDYFVAPPGNMPLPKLEDRDTFLQKDES